MRLRPSCIILCLVLTIGYSKTVRAQDTTNTIGSVSIASPTAAALGKYGDIPVSYNTGIPNISIPIYTVEAGSLKLPIGLSYHASGLKVQEGASWVGAGWSLNAGGVITRTVVGAPDDRGLQCCNITTNGWYSDTGYNSYLFVSRGHVPGAAYDGYLPDDFTFCQGFKDAEPDLYFFNFGGYTGKFYFNDDQTPIFVPEEDFRVQPDLNNAVGGMGFQGFIITTPDGVRYYFGKTGNNNTSVTPVELTSTATTQYTYLAANQTVSSWYLNKIVSPDGIDSITLNYQQEYYAYYTVSMSPVSNAPQPGAAPSSITGFNVVKNFVNGVRLSQINFPNGNITFTRAASPRTDLAGGYNINTGIYDAADTGTYASYALGSISITNANGFCKKDSLSYGYFHDANATTLNYANYNSYNFQSDAYRLRLDSVKETSCDGSASVPPYKFSYFSELVPRKLSFGIDHWGFSNGVTTNQGLIPTYSYITSSGSIVQVMPGANRDASWPAMRGGALQQITYPTGGYTTFTFQPNDTYVQATNYVSTFRMAPAIGYDNSTIDTVGFISTGNTFQFALQNNAPSGGETEGDGVVEVYYESTHGLAYGIGSASPGQTDTFYFAVPPGQYYLQVTKSPASTGFTTTVNENVPVQVNGNDTVGGLRIGSISNYDGLNPNPIVTSYAYNTGGTQSSGILYSRPVYVQSLRNDAFGWINGPNDGSPGGCDLNAATFWISPSSISPLSTIQGNHIGYNQVQVSQTGNGYSIYRYYGSNYWDNIISDVCVRTINSGAACTAGNIPTFPAPPLPFDPMRGELKYEGHFNQAGHVLKETTYTPVYVMDALTTPAEKFINVSGFYCSTPYSLQSAKKAQTTVWSTTYDQNGAGSVSNTSVTYYGSNYHHSPTRKVTTTSTGDSLATNTLYAADIRIATCDAIPDSSSYFATLINTDSGQFFLHLDSCTLPDNICRLDTLANMRRHVNIARNQFVRYRRRSFFGPTSLQATCYLTAEASADTTLKPILRLKDEFNNPPLEVSSWRDNRLLHANFTQYDTSQSPIGFVYPAKTQLINLQSSAGSFASAAVSGNSLTRDSRYLDESIYTFNKGNPLQVTPHSGVNTSYIWDYLNKQPIAKVTNATVDQVGYTSFEADGTGTWYVPSSSRDTGGITGNACYNLINGPIIRSGLNSASNYVVSYWSKHGSYAFNGTTSTLIGKTVGPWTYYEHNVTGVTSANIYGDSDIDEVRLYPQGAQMTTYTYTPLVGMSSQCDVDNRITYYTYDPLGRLRYVQDQDRNIVKTYQYHYKGQ